MATVHGHGEGGPPGILTLTSWDESCSRIQRQRVPEHEEPRQDKGACQHRGAVGVGLSAGPHRAGILSTPQGWARQGRGWLAPE